MRAPGVGAMIHPRQVLPGRYYFLTRRTTQRMFLLRPDELTTEAFLYCLAEAASRYEIVVLLPSMMSNHHHTTIYDPHGRLVEFMTRFHSLVARCVNSLRGRWENFWSVEPASVVTLEGPSDVLDKLVYAATNPVKDGLVERAHHWPASRPLAALLNDRPLRVRRPARFFRERGKMPKELELKLTLPADLGDPTELRRQLRERIAAVEDEHAARRARTGQRVLGRRQCLRQSWREAPASIEPRRTLSPRVAARCKWARIEALQRNREFIVAYRKARAALLAKTPIPFPPGTYWLAKHAGVEVLEPPKH